ncbi:MAG: DUF3325 family protein [Lautropia sp.]
MSPQVAVLGSVVGSIAGMILLGLASARHRGAARRAADIDVRAGRLAGAALLAIAAVPAAVGSGPAVGVVVWCGGLSVGTLATALLLAYARRAAGMVAAGAGSIAGAIATCAIAAVPLG